MAKLKICQRLAMPRRDVGRGHGSAHTAPSPSRGIGGPERPTQQPGLCGQPGRGSDSRSPVWTSDLVELRIAPAVAQLSAYVSEPHFTSVPLVQRGDGLAPTAPTASRWPFPPGDVVPTPARGFEAPARRARSHRGVAFGIEAALLAVGQSRAAWFPCRPCSARHQIGPRTTSNFARQATSGSAHRPQIGEQVGFLAQPQIAIRAKR